ncbi:MAG: 3'(2'),5'-bisphosphate nucleotidase CysQ [Candidatus Sumerlaeia bacterium]|nr:3'(2'),5'-bisphosphate nucleotidase CysQ [Candidatus Sumerlaeia bacterium]
MMAPEDILRHRRLAREAVLYAWGCIAELRFSSLEIIDKPDGPQTPADLIADHAIMQWLGAHAGKQRYAFLTEETEDSDARFHKEMVWIIDPIDGTREFIEGRDDFAMHVALAERLPEGARLLASAVYAPVLGRLYTASLGGGATLEVEARGAEDPYWWEGLSSEHRTPDRAAFLPPKPLGVSGNAPLSDCVAVVSRNHRTKRLRALLERVDFRNVLERGSLGVKVCLVAEGAADLYVNTERGRGKEWDLAAPQLVLTEAGGRVTDLDGGEPRYNQRDVALPAGIVASNGLCHEAFMSAAAGVPGLYSAGDADAVPS